MKNYLICFVVVLLCTTSANSQVIRETFDSNSLNWNECASESNSGTAVIDKGVLTLTSKGANKFWSAMLNTEIGTYTVFTCFCYAPLNVKRSFEINTNVTIGQLDDDKLVGLIFNYKGSSEK